MLGPNLASKPRTGLHAPHPERSGCRSARGPIPSASGVPLRKGTSHTDPNSGFPLRRHPDGRTHTHTHSHSLDPGSSSRSSPFHTRPRLPPLCTRRGGGGARTCPRRPRPDKAPRAERALRRPHPAPANTHPSPGLRLNAGQAGSHETARGRRGSGRTPAQTPAPRSPGDPEARGSTRRGGARPARSARTSPAGAGPGARGGASGAARGLGAVLAGRGRGLEGAGRGLEGAGRARTQTRAGAATFPGSMGFAYDRVTSIYRLPS